MSEEESVESEKKNEKENEAEESGKEADKESEGEAEVENSPFTNIREQKSIKENNEEEESEIIEFSTLSKEEKIKYFNFFIANNTVFVREPLGTYIAEIEIIDEDKTKKDEELFKPNNNLRQSTFRTTKKDYDTIYSKLIKVINPSTAIKGTKMNINVIRYMIQEIYGLKFYKDTQALFNNSNEEPEDFPQFVGNFLINKFSKKETLDKKSVDFMLSLDYYGRNHKDIKIFQQFLTEEYDADDLIFYLFIRSNIEKTLKVSFVDKAKENLNQNILYDEEGDDDILVPFDKCKTLSKAIFGTEKELQKSFMRNVEQLFDTPAADKKNKTLKANSILNMELRNYHESRGSRALKEEDNEDDDEEEEKPKKAKSKSKPKKKKKIEIEEEKEEDSEEEEKPKTKLKTENKKGHTKNLSMGVIKNPTSPNKSKNTKTNKTNTNTIKIAKTNTNTTTSTNKNKNTNVNKTKNTKTNTNKINTNSGNKTTTINKNNNIKNNVNTTQSPVKKTNAKGGGSTSVKKVNNSSKKNNNNEPVKTNENEGGLSDFKNILGKNRVDKVKDDKDKSEFLRNIISDYFRYKVIDKFFKNMIDSNPMLKAFQSQINKNLKNTKEFSLRKLNAIDAFVAAGDKNAFCNFMKLKEKDKANRNYFDTMKKSFNNILKIGSLKNLSESAVNSYCKIVLDFPEFTLQVSKDLLKNCD